MTGLVTQVPLKLVCAAVIGLTAAAALTVLLGWHGLRRALDVPRVPRPAGMYVALGALWLALVAVGATSAVTIALLRDHQRVDERTALAEVRCEAAGADHVRVELRTARAATPEVYDVPGGACLVWVKQVELRPGLGLLGLRVLSRVEGVGAAPASTDNRAPALIDLVARRAEAVPVSVPVDARAHSVVVSSLRGPTLDDVEALATSLSAPEARSPTPEAP